MRNSMTLAPRMGLRDMDRMMQQMDDWFWGMPRRTGQSGPRQVRPAWRSMTNDDGVGVEVELPGFDRSEIELEIDEQMLTVIAEHREVLDEEPSEATDDDENDDGPTEQESRVRVTERRVLQLRIPEEIDPDAIEARLNNGLLQVMLPRRPVEETRRRIEISG